MDKDSKTLHKNHDSYQSTKSIFPQRTREISLQNRCLPESTICIMLYRRHSHRL